MESGCERIGEAIRNFPKQTETMQLMKIELRRPKKILFATDGSEGAENAAQCAKLIANRFGAALIVLHVLEPVSYPTELLGSGLLNEPSRRDIAFDDIRAVVGRTLAGSQPEILVVEGDPSRTITKTAEDMHADIVVMATRGKGAFRRFLLGSVTAKVLNDAAVPVLTTTHTDEGNQSCSPKGVTKILCAVALDDRAESVCRAAVLVAAEYSASLTLVHVLEGAATSDAHREHALTRLHKMAADNGVSPTFCVETGSPDNVIGSVARATAADLVVIGRSSPGPLGRLRAQSYGIIRESPCPVLSV